MKRRGFTLAEVLITLMIIGIVAALTIPSVISNYQQQEFKTGLKKAVSVLNKAIQTNIALEGETPYENKDLANYLKRHMNVVQANISLDDYIGLEKTHGHLVKYGSNRHFYTADGMRYEFTRFAYNENLILHESGIKVGATENNTTNFSEGRCGSYGLLNNKKFTLTAPCLVTVDVNGDKKPNPIVDIVYWANGNIKSANPNYLYPAVKDKKLTDVFPILITDEKAIPFGVVAQRAMYSK